MKSHNFRIDLRFWPFIGVYLAGGLYGWGVNVAIDENIVGHIENLLKFLEKDCGRIFLQDLR